MALTSRGVLRLLLFLGGYIVYLVLGATVFSAIESPEELQKVQHLRKLRADFLKNHPTVTVYHVGKIAIRSLQKSLVEEIQLSQEAARIRYQQLEKNTSSLSPNISLSEAKQILNITDLDPVQIQKRFEFLFEANEKTNGGSFYIQSKIFRAKERLDAEILRLRDCNV